MKMQTIPLNKIFNYELLPDYKCVSIKAHGHGIDNLNTHDRIIFNHEKNDYIVFIYTTIRDRLSCYNGFKYKHYTIQTLPQKYKEFIY